MCAAHKQQELPDTKYLLSSKKWLLSLTVKVEMNEALEASVEMRPCACVRYPACNMGGVSATGPLHAGRLCRLQCLAHNMHSTSRWRRGRAPSAIQKPSSMPPRQMRLLPSACFRKGEKASAATVNLRGSNHARMSISIAAACACMATALQTLPFSMILGRLMQRA